MSGSLEKYFDDLAAGDPESLFLLVALYFLLAGTYSLIYCFRLRNWPSVIGQLHSDEVSAWHSDAIAGDRQYFSKATYTYEVDGKQYEGHRVSPFYMTASHNVRFLLEYQRKYIERPTPSTARVFYNKNKPQKSYLVVPGWLGISIVVVFGVTPMLLHVFV